MIFKLICISYNVKLCHWKILTLVYKHQTFYFTNTFKIQKMSFWCFLYNQSSANFKRFKRFLNYRTLKLYDIQMNMKLIWSQNHTKSTVHIQFQFTIYRILHFTCISLRCTVKITWRCSNGISGCEDISGCGDISGCDSITDCGWITWIGRYIFNSQRVL